MNIRDLKFPCVIIHHVSGAAVGSTFIMYNPTSAIVIEVESDNDHYNVGQVVEGRIGFRLDDEHVRVEKMPFDNTRYYDALVKLAKHKQRELDVMNFVLRGCEDEQQN